jgi:SPP1 family phage portal protein
MELEELQLLIPDFAELKKKIAEERGTTDFATMQKQYNPKDHDIKDPAKRPDKIVESDNGASTVPVSRLSIAFQKQIVSRAAAFLVGNPIVLRATAKPGIETDFLSVMQKTWDDNKLDYESKSLVKTMKSETEVAELWYTEVAEPEYWLNTPNDGSQFRLRVKIIANSKGDSLYPVFNKSGDMIAFGRAYIVKEAGKNVEHYDVYTDKTIYYGVKSDQGFLVENKPNVVGKIPVVYYSQPEPEWADVQDLIDRLERLISNHADTNDYFGSPIIFVEGEVLGFAKKGEQGKVIEAKNGAKASYLSWDNSPESVKLEMENLRSLIFGISDTPDISFDKVAGMGAYSGIALKMIFLGAHMKAADGEEIFGKGIQRRINYLKAALAKINVKLEPALPLSIKPKFEYYVPKNEMEKIEMLNLAAGAKAIISQKTAVSLNPLVEDAETEMKNLEDEAPTLDDQFNV